MLDARVKAPTYPDADQRAAARLTIRRRPADSRFEVIDSIGPRKVSAAEEGPMLVTMSVIVWVAGFGSAKRPTRETRAISAGKSDRSP
jgi:hypothetical protein